SSCRNARMLVITMSSSSTIRTCGCPLSVKALLLKPLGARLFYGDAHGEGRAQVQLGFETDFTAVGVLDDLARDRQTQACALANGLSGKASGENPGTERK